MYSWQPVCRMVKEATRLLQRVEHGDPGVVVWPCLTGIGLHCACLHLFWMKFPFLTSLSREGVPMEVKVGRFFVPRSILENNSS